MNDKLDPVVLQQIDALCDITPAAGSTERAIAATEARLISEWDAEVQCEAIGVRKERQSRFFGPRTVYAVAAASLLVVIGVIAWGTGPKVTFAAMQERLRQTQTVTYTSVSQHNGEPATARWFISGRRTRREESNGDIYVMDENQGRSMHIRTKQRRVSIRIDTRPRKARKTAYENLRSLHTHSTKRLGKRRIDGRTAIGFVVSEVGSGSDMKVWIDNKTSLPVLVEATGGRILKDFSFDGPLKDELFAIKAPQGYQVQREFASIQPGKKLVQSELQKLLSIVADKNRTALQTADAFLRLTVSGRDQEAAKLGDRLSNAAEIRELDGFRELSVAAIYTGAGEAMAVTSKLKYRFKHHSGVLYLFQAGNGWLVRELDLNDDEKLKEAKAEFLRENPTAVEWTRAN